MRIFARLVACLCLAANLLLAAPPAPSRAPSAATPRALSDAQIEQDLRARLSRSKLATRKFQFHIQGGVATIEGRTDIIQHKGIMTRMARAAGARLVVNKIEVSEAARQRAAERLDGVRRRATVRHQSTAAKTEK